MAEKTAHWRDRGIAPPLGWRAALAVCALGVLAGEVLALPRRVVEVRFGTIDPPVVFQKDITHEFTTNNTSKLTKPIECAGMAYADGRLLIISDRHEHCVFAANFDLAKMRLEDPKQFPIIANESKLLQDAEAITVLAKPDGVFAAYVLCSLSNHRTEQSLPMRRHAARFTFPAGEKFVPAPAIVVDATPIRDSISGYFERLSIPPYRTFYNEATTENRNTYRWANVEGISFTPDGKSLIAGFRNPLTHGQAGEALLATITGVDAAFDTEDPAQFEVTDLFTLDLGDRGVSSISWDPMTKGYLIAAARSNGPKLDKDQPFPPNSLDSALFWWSGRKKEKPVLFATAPEMKIEAMCRLGFSRFIAFASDEGDESEGRDQRQSVLTVMDFTGFK